MNKTIILLSSIWFGVDDQGILGSNVRINDILTKKGLAFKNVKLVYKEEFNYSKTFKYENNLRYNLNSLTKEIRTILSNSMIPVQIGSDHSSIIASLTAYEDSQNLGVVVLDAHADFNTERTSLSGNVHGMSTWIVTEKNNNKDMTFFNIPEKNIMICGLRDVDSKELKRLKDSEIRTFNSNIELRLNDYEQSLSNFISEYDNIHLSLDLDVLDPFVFPAVSVPVNGGLKYQELKTILVEIFSTGKVTSIDIVEFNVIRDVEKKSEKLLSSLIDFILQLANQ